MLASRRSLAARAARRAGAAALAGALALGACGGGGDSEAALAVAGFAEISSGVLPDRVLDLDVTPEDFSATISEGRESYIDALGLFGLRRDELLQATLQVSRFGEPDQLRDPFFRRQVAAQVGGSSTPKISRVGEYSVFLVPSGGQTLGIWFGEDSMYVLTVRGEYEQPRRLLRALMEQTAVAEPVIVTTTTTTASDSEDIR